MQVHRLMCFELKEMIECIVSMVATIESARPRSSAGVQALCLLHDAVDKAKMLIQHCSESSKLYLVCTFLQLYCQVVQVEILCLQWNVFL